MNGDIIQRRAAARPDTMIDCVEDLHTHFARLEAEGCQVFGRIGDSGYDKVGWVIDREGIQVEV